jgi:hypothetical protein
MPSAELSCVIHCGETMTDPVPSPDPVARLRELIEKLGPVRWGLEACSGRREDFVEMLRAFDTALSAVEAEREALQHAAIGRDMELRRRIHEILDLSVESHRAVVEHREERARLEAEVAALRADKERLDWLNRNPPDPDMRPITSISREQIDLRMRPAARAAGEGKL